MSEVPIREETQLEVKDNSKGDENVRDCEDEQGDDPCEQERRRWSEDLAKYKVRRAKRAVKRNAPDKHSRKNPMRYGTHEENRVLNKLEDTWTTMFEYIIQAGGLSRYGRLRLRDLIESSEIDIE